MQFAVNPGGRMTAGVEIAADQMVTVLVDLAGRCARSAAVAAQPTPRRTRVAPLVSAEIAAALDATDDGPSACWASAW